jgi:hypothetical protein
MLLAEKECSVAVRTLASENQWPGVKRLMQKLNFLGQAHKALIGKRWWTDSSTVVGEKASTSLVTTEMEFFN